MSTSSSAAPAAPTAAPRRSVLRGPRATGVDRHAFAVVSELPRLALTRPAATGDRNADALRDAAWTEGEAAGHAEGHARGYAEGFEAARAAGYAEGHTRGVEAGRQAAAAEHDARIAPLLHALSDAASALVERDAASLTDIESDVVALALDLAGAILEREVAAAADPGADAIRRALKLAPERGQVTVHLNPADVECLGDSAAIAPGRHLEVVADPSIRRGGCRIESDAATVDARIETALSRARAALAGSPSPRAQGPVRS